MKRLSSVKELLAEVTELLAGIEAAYDEAKTKESVVVVARPKVKSCLEHLRSALEYIATDLVETLPTRPKRWYFPYGRDAILYAESLNRNLPGLESRYATLVESLQPHVCGDDWLLHLAGASNFNKHVDLEDQERKNLDPTLTLGGLVSVGGGSTIGKLIIEGQVVNPKGPMSAHTDIADLELPASLPARKTYRDVKFILKGTGVDLLELLKSSHGRIGRFVEELERV